MRTGSAGGRNEDGGTGPAPPPRYRHLKGLRRASPHPVEEAPGFRIHAIVFVQSIVALLVIKLLICSRYWSLWVLPVLGPGVGKAEAT
jgi:hypothetical protein